MPINDISSIFSQNTTAAKKKLEEIEANRPGAYQSNWQGTINSLMDKIVNQKDFSYDFNADPLYQQYKDQYTQLGKQAAMDTQANAATLTGGFGNSYAATAATQANQQYLTQLNNVIPQLYSLAMDKYQMDTDKLYNQFSAVGSQEDREYGQYRDTVTDWKDDRGYYYNKYNDSIGNDQFIANYNPSEDQFNQNMAYNRERDAIADSQWQQQFEYNKGRDNVSDSQWQQSFNYQQQRDNVSDSQWEKQYALSLAKSKSSGSGSSGRGSSGSKSSGSSKIGKGLEKEIKKVKQVDQFNYLSGKFGNVADKSYANMLASNVNKGIITQEEANAILKKKQQEIYTAANKKK